MRVAKVFVAQPPPRIIPPRRAGVFTKDTLFARGVTCEAVVTQRLKALTWRKEQLKRITKALRAARKLKQTTRIDLLLAKREVLHSA
jgi:hypothetical protein